MADAAAPNQAQPQAQSQAQPQDSNNQQPKGGTPRDPGRTYTQADMDRITDKVRRNAARDAEIRVRRELGSQPQQPSARQDDTPAPRQDEDEKEPDRKDFDTFEAFQKAVAEHAGRKAARAETKRVREEQETKEREERNKKAAETWMGKIKAAQAKHLDFQTVLEDNEETFNRVYSSPIRAFVLDSDIGPEIVRHLCLHPDEVTRILALPGYKQAAAIAKIEDELTAAAKPADDKGDENDDGENANDDQPGDGKQPKTDAQPRGGDGRYTAAPKKEPSKAPDPIEPVGARSANTSSKPSDKDDADTWRRKRTAEIEARRKGQLKTG